MVGPKSKKMVFMEGIVECFWSFRRTIGRDTTPWGEATLDSKDRSALPGQPAMGQH